MSTPTQSATPTSTRRALRWVGSVLCAVAVLGGAVLAASPATAAGVTTRASVASDGIQANAASSLPALSADGRRVAFISSASNLVADDSNGRDDVFVHDNQTHDTWRVNLTAAGAEPSGPYLVGDVELSGDGRVVVFTTDAALLPIDLSVTWDVYVRKLDTAMLERVSVAGTTSGSHSSGISASHVADRATGTVVNVSRPVEGTSFGGSSADPSLSADGTRVAFTTTSRDLGLADSNGAGSDIVLRDLTTGTLTMVSVSNAGTQTSGANVTPDLSADGRYVSFRSNGANPGAGTDFFPRDTVAATTVQVSVGNGTSGTGGVGSRAAAVTAHGQYVAFASAAMLAPAACSSRRIP